MPKKYGSNIQQLREDLFQIARELRRVHRLSGMASRIERTVAKNGFRSQSGRTAPKTRRKLESIPLETKWQIVDLLKTTDLSQDDIGSRFNLRGGRVSEVWWQYLRGELEDRHV